MARFGSVVLIAIAACGGDHGAFLSITSPTALSRVELFVGEDTVTDPGSCSAGTGCRIGPPTTNVTTNPLGIRYTGDGFTSRAEVAAYAKVSGTTLTYQLEPSGEDEKLPAMMIVGYDSTGTPVAALVLHDVPVTHEAEELDVTLTAVGSIDGTSGERVQVWRRPGDDAGKLSACALIVHGDSRAPEWFVPGDDTDCDGALPQDQSAPECRNSDAAWNYCGVYAPFLSQTDSLSQSLDTGACRLAGPQCADAGPACKTLTTSAALTSPIGCITPEVCHVTAQMGCSSFDDACVGMALANNILPRVSCPAFSAVSATPCTTRIDPTFGGSGIAPIIAGRTVNRLDITQVAPFLTGQQSVTIAGGTYTLQATAMPAVYDLVITGSPIDGPGVLLLDYVTDPTPTQHRFIEVYLESTTAGCGAGGPTPCQIATSPYICP